ncbi:MAG: transglycosylase SLT domain-containing protein [Oligoflexales bacterium]
MLDKAYRPSCPLAVLVFSLVLQSCSTSNHQVYELDASDDLLNPFINSNNAFLPPPYNVIEKKEDALSPTTRRLSNFIPLAEKADHPQVAKWIRYFNEQQRDVFQNFINRGAKFRLLIEKQLIDNGLPKEIFYLAMIESGFIIRAKSRAGAVGPWQFIRGTGRRFGLNINAYVDERLDPIRSTQAAVRYLRSLYKVFNSWELAFAAYNSGESRVMNTIIKHGVRDYWKLIEMKALPRETRNYVPKFIAAAILGQRASSYGFSNPEPLPSPEVLSVSVPSPVHIRNLAKTLKINYREFKRLNPNLLRKITPTNLKNYSVWVPARSNVSKSLIAQLKPLRKNSRAFKDSRDLEYQKYRIRRGDTLISIARKFKASVSLIRKANKMRGNRILAGRLIRVPTYNRRNKYVKYLVRKGDNLYHVAKKFGSSIKKIKNINSMRHSRIYAGQTLRVPKNRG